MVVRVVIMFISFRDRGFTSRPSMKGGGVTRGRILAFGSRWQGEDCSITVNMSNSAYCSVQGVLFDKHAKTLVQDPGDRFGSDTVPGGGTNFFSEAF